jgi:hypothetical protein
MNTALLLMASLALAEDSPTSPGKARVFGSTRASVAVPTGYTGVAQSYSAEVGAMFEDGNQLALRFAFVPQPPDVFGPDTPDAALGPVVSWAYNIRVARQFDLYPAACLGAVFGPAPTTKINMVLPYIQGGLGARARFKTASGSEVALGPEIGFVPTILAPYVGFNLGLIGAPPAPVAP